MTRVGIGELRDHVSEYVQRAERGETIVILNRSREVAILRPLAHARKGKSGFLGCMKGTGRAVGDLLEPTSSADDWFRT